MKIGKLFSGILKAAARPFGILTCVLLLLALLVWLLGPLIAVGEIRPIAPVAVRLAILLILALVWGVVGIVVRGRRRTEDRTLLEAARRDQEEKKAASKRVEVTANARFALFVESARGALRMLGGADRLASLWGARRALPRYLVLGPGGSGKTTMLLNAGLSVHSDSLRESGDEPAQFLVSEEGLFVEISGSYLRQSAEHEQAVWLRMLDFIRRRRPTQPVNGVLLAVSAGDLVAMGEEEAEAFGASMRRRIDDIDKRFRARPPVYIILTKLDLLVGFEEFFDSLTTDERDTVFGFPLWSPGQSPAPPQRLTVGFGEIMGRLKERQIRRLHEEADEKLRLRTFEFPGQFALLETRLSAVIDALSSQSRFGAAPLLRGVFFTSAIQTGLSRDPLPSALAPNFALKPAALGAKAAPAALRPRPFFVRGLVHHAVLAEPGLAGYSRSAAAARKLRSVSLNVAAGLAIFAFAVLWWLSYSDGRAYTARLADEVKAAETRLAAIDGQDAKSLTFPPVLGALDSLEVLAHEAPRHATLGLYSATPAREAGGKAYDRGLRALLRPYVLKYAETGLDSPALDVTARFELLKFYLMLGGVRPLDPAVARLVAPGFTATMIPSAAAADEGRLAAHLVALTSVDLPDQPVDEALVDRARARIAETGLAKLAYDILATQADVRALSPWRPVDHMGTEGPQVLARVSGDSLWNGIEGLYTREGYHSTLLPESDRVSQQVAGDLWVMGKGTSEIDVRQQAGRIRDGVFDLYIVDTIRRWDSFLADLTAAPVSDAGEAASLIATITKEPSPVNELLTAIANETNFEASSSAAAGSLLAKTKLSRAEKLISAVPRRVVNVAKSVTDHYARLAAAVGVGEKTDDKQAKQTQVGALLAAFQPLYAQLNLVATGGDVLSLGTKPQDTLGDLDRMAQELPDLLQPFFERLIVQMATVTGVSSRERLAQIWDTTVLPQCRSVIAGQYPFDPKSKSDASLADFAAVFGPKGAIASFREGYLKPFIDTSAKPWQWHAGQKVGLGLGEDVLAAFERADAISSTYFDQSEALGVKFQVKPLGLDGAASAFQFDYGGPVYVYAHGPAIPVTVTWPPQDAGAQASLSVTPEITGERSIILREGSWALFRLLEAGRKIKSDQTGPGTTDLRFSVGSRSVILEITAPATGDPIGGDLLSGYSCPQLMPQQSADL